MLGDLVFVQIFFVDPWFHFTDIGHSLHEQECCHDHTDLDSHNQIEEYRQKQGCDQDENIAFRCGLNHVAKCLEATHVVGNHNQDCSKTGHRNHRCIRHQEQQNQQQGDCMDDTGDWCTSAVFDIGCGSCNRSGCRDTAEEGRHDIADALTD